MKTIYKYILLNTLTELTLPIGSNVLSAQNQNDKICLWIEQETNNDTVVRNFEFFGTGCELSKNATVFIDTVQISGFVFHVYELLGE